MTDTALLDRASAAEQAYDALLEDLRAAAEKCVGCGGTGTRECSVWHVRDETGVRSIREMECRPCPHCAPMRALIAKAERGMPND